MLSICLLPDERYMSVDKTVSRIHNEYKTKATTKKKRKENNIIKENNNKIIRTFNLFKTIFQKCPYVMLFRKVAL
jgi:hypothetical protein